MTILLRNSQRVLHAKEYTTNLVNETSYNPYTWAEWTKDAGVVGDIIGLEFTANGTGYIYAKMFNTNFKVSTKYGLLVNCISNNLTASLYLENYIIPASITIVPAGTVGNIKIVFTTRPVINNNIISIFISNGVLNTKIKIKDIRIIELPAGSQIESDFTNLTADQLNAKYPYNSFRNTIYMDRTRFANNGTFSNVTWTQLPSGLFVNQFNGTTSYIEIPDSPTMRMTQGGTISCWVKANSAGSGNLGRIVDKSSDGNFTNGYGLYIDSALSVRFRVNAGASTVSTIGILPINTWKLVSITFSSSGRKLYVNGIEDNGYNGKTEIGLPPNFAYITRIGSRSSAINNNWDGQISGMKLTQEVLTQAKVLREFNATRAFYEV